MADALSYCDQFITTCESAKEIILNNLPKIKDIPFTVIPHGRDFSAFLEPKQMLSDKIINVLVPGNITLTKGKFLIRKIKELDKGNQIHFHVLGTCDKDIIDIVTYHGKYNRNDFTNKVKLINPDISAVFSIWPETYCHTLTESWASGLPVIGLAYGAVERRINEHDAGWLVQNDPLECYQQLIALCNNPSLIIEKQKKVMEWQNGYGAYNTVSRMTEEYIHIYQNAFKTKIPEKRTMGMVLKGHYPNVPPTAYVRLIDWKSEFEQQTNLKVEFISWEDLLTQKCNELSKVIIQRDAIPSFAVDWCINSLDRNLIPYEYEIDDNLLSVPDVIDTEGVYKNYRNYFIKLISNAKLVHVTNEFLASVVREYNNNITIRPNKIFPHRWDVNIPPQDEINLIKEPSITNVLYFGSRTHQEDLNFLSDVINSINDECPRFHLYVIGCGEFIESKYITRLTPPNSRYDLFVSWLIRISRNFDLGVAPLIDEQFANTKSPLKAIELLTLNLPVVCSDISPYSDLRINPNIDNYKKIIFVKNEIGSWKDELLNFKGYHYDQA